ncbi:MAG: heme-binding domain-containing protein [Phaeodactylibacter sp.]|nr:heme-binding domain-containing protein [Phaeodactylibacter sp.]
MKIVKRILLGLALVLLVMQFFRIDKSQPSVVPAQDFLTIYQPDVEVATLIKQTCYDCHSYQTEFPWYTNIAPVSWWIKHHIDEGTEHLNFSIWGTYPAGKAAHKLEECAEEVEEGHMPLPSYTWMHGAAKLSDAQRQQLSAFFEGLYHEAEGH